METAKDIFFFVGSFLGILAFLRISVDALRIRDRRAWDHFREMITEADLRNLEFQVELSRRIDSQLLSRLGNLVNLIQHDDENVRFGPLLRKHFRRHLDSFVRLYFELREFVQVPWWQPERAEGDGEADRIDWFFCKKAFFSGEYPQAGTYVDHLRMAADIVAAMRVEHRALSTLSELDLVEIPLAARIVRRRSSLPKRQEAVKTDEP
jgi:hypothetical protein